MPLRDYRGYLSDVIEAGHEIQGFLEGKTFEDYLEDKLLRYAVERKLTVLGEALAQAKQHFPHVQEDIILKCRFNVTLVT